MHDFSTNSAVFGSIFADVRKVMAKSRFFSGHDFEHVAVTASTNDDLKRQWEENGLSKKLLVADFQTAGRGQFDRKWQAGNREALLFSFSFSCDIDEKPWSLIVGAALWKAVADVSPDAGNRGIWLKWPNDVWIGNGKLAGILVEGSVYGNKRHMVAGIGLNIICPAFIGVNGAGLFEQNYYEARADVLCSFIKAWDAIVVCETCKILDLWKSSAGKFWESKFRFELPDGELFVAKPVDLMPDGRIIVDEKGRSRIIASASLKLET